VWVEEEVEVKDAGTQDEMGFSRWLRERSGRVLPTRK